jgi:Holliday junction DNA helicase RuvA
MLAVHSPDALRRAVATGDEKALTAVPGIGKKGAQRLLLELKDRLGAPLGTGAPAPAPAAARGPAPWHEQLHAALTGLGYAPREADRAVSDVTPTAEAALADGTAPDVGALLRAALQGLGRSR